MMTSFVPIAGMAVMLFAWTNLDDLFVLLGFFSDPSFGARHVVIGQYLGISVIYAISVLASLLSFVIAPAYVGLLGLVPIYMGLSRLASLWRRAQHHQDHRRDQRAAATSTAKNILTVATATVANSGDNISVYTPLFATRSAAEVAVTGAVFAIMTAFWCLLGQRLVQHPALGAPIRRYGHRTLPFILIGFGILILYEAGTLKLI